jgi:hypothetical protein
MHKLTAPLILLSLFISGCKKNSDHPIWERSFGTGTAFFTKVTADSGIISCGETGGRPFFIRLDKNKNKVAEFKSSIPGLYSSAWSDNVCFIAAGSSEGKMLLERFDNKLNSVWDTTLTTTYYIDQASLCYLGNGNLLAVGTTNPDSISSGVTGLLFVWFDTTGSVTNRREIKESSSISAKKVVTDNSGNIYLALTRRNIGAKSQAAVAKYNSQLQKLWETELYNNPIFGASSLGIALDNSGNVYVSGKTELSVANGVLNNSFLASITTTGNVRWKKYLENSNSGSAVILDGTGLTLMLNLNCFIISRLDPADGTDSGRIRVFDVCDSYKTDALGFDFDINFDGNILMAGSKGGGFYLILKSSL